MAVGPVQLSAASGPAMESVAVSLFESRVTRNHFLHAWVAAYLIAALLLPKPNS
jgi:hypothetical protein